MANKTVLSKKSTHKKKPGKGLSDTPNEIMVSHDSIVAKSNEAARLMSRLGLQEMRLLAFCLAHYDSRSATNRAFRARVRDMVDIFPQMDKHSAYRIVQETIVKFNAKTINKDYIDAETGKRITSTVFWFSSFDYVHEDGLFIFKLSPETIPYLLELKGHFYKYPLGIARKFTSPLAWKLYENLKSHKTQPQSGKWYVSLEELRDLLAMEGKYPRWDSFKANVIDRSLAKINELTDIQVEYKVNKQGRKIDGIMFFIQSQEDFSIKDPALVANIGDTVNDVRLLMDLGLNKKNSEKLSLMAQEAGKDLAFYLEQVLTRWHQIPAVERRKSKQAYVYKALEREFYIDLFDQAAAANAKSGQGRLKTDDEGGAEESITVALKEPPPPPSQNAGNRRLTEQIRKKLKSSPQLTVASYETWIQPLIFELQNDAVVAKGPNVFFMEWAGKHYHDIIEEAIISLGLGKSVIMARE